MKRLVLSAGVVMLLGLPVVAQVEPITCITDIVEGTTIDFEQGGRYVNEVLPNYDMRAVPDKLITTFTYVVTGNECAPIKNLAGFGENFKIETTDLPWDKIGLTAIGSITNQDRVFTLTAYDENGVKLGELTRRFEPGNNFPESYNKAAIFLGFSSESKPIHSIKLVSDNPNVGWDHIRFHTTSGINCDDIKKFRVKCKRGKLKGLIKRSKLPQGTLLTLLNNGADPKGIVINRRGKGGAKWKNQSGRHKVTVEECPDLPGKSADCG